MDEGCKVHCGWFVVRGEATEVLQPRFRALSDPLVLVPPQFLFVLRGTTWLLLRAGMIGSMCCLASKARTLLLW
jgi:hypothetical protein